MSTKSRLEWIAGYDHRMITFFPILNRKILKGQVMFETNNPISILPVVSSNPMASPHPDPLGEGMVPTIPPSIGLESALPAGAPMKRHLWEET